MNILIVTPIFPPEIGGPASYTQSLARHLNRDHKVTIIAFGRQSPPHIPNVRIISVSLIGNTLTRQWRLYKAIRGVVSTIDTIYAQGTVTVGLASLLVAKVTGKPLIVKFVGDEVWESHRGQKNLETYYRHPHKSLKLFLHRLVLHHAKAIITPSRYLKKFLISAHHCNTQKIRVIPNAIETPSLTIKKNPHQLIFVGRLVAWKHVDEIIQAVEQARRHKPWQLLIVGDGPERKKLELVTRKLFVRANDYSPLPVTFAGKLSHQDSLKAIAASQKLILYSSYEGQPHVLLEAMRYKTQIIISDIPPHRELVGKSGILVKPHSPQLLAAAINRPINKPLLKADYEKSLAYNWVNHQNKLLEQLTPSAHVLAISLDTALLTQSYGAARQRQQQYADTLGSYTLIVLNRGQPHLPTYHHKNLHIMPTNSSTRIHQLSDALYQARQIIKHQPINVVTAQDPLLTGLIAVIISKAAHIPLNLQLHGAFRYGFFTPFANFITSQAESIRAVDRKLTTTLQKRYPSKLIRHVPIGTDTSYFFHPVSHNSTLTKFVTVGRLETEKNYPLLLHAFAALVKSHQNLSLTIVGTGSQRKKLELVTRHLALENNVKFTGGLNSRQLKQQLHQADAFIFGSNHEGWGMALIEAAAAGLPILTTNVGLIGDILRPQKHAIVVPVGHQSRMTAALEWVVHHPKESRAMARAAQKQVTSLFNQEQTTLQWTQLLKDTARL